MKTLSKTTEKSDNELIAEFMGMACDFRGTTRVQYYKDEYAYKPKELAFATSWDWLMPVVEKISGMFLNPVEGEDIPEITGQVIAVTLNPIDTSIQKVYADVVEFIKWYNLNQITPSHDRHGAQSNNG